MMCELKKHDFLTHGRNGVATYGKKGCWDFFVRAAYKLPRTRTPIPYKPATPPLLFLSLPVR